MKCGESGRRQCQEKRDQGTERKDRQRRQGSQRATTSKSDRQPAEYSRTRSAKATTGSACVRRHHGGERHQGQEVGSTLDAAQNQQEFPRDGKHHERDRKRLYQGGHRKDSPGRLLPDSTDQGNRQQCTEEGGDGKQLDFRIGLPEALSNERFQPGIGKNIRNRSKYQKRKGPATDAVGAETRA